MESNVSNRYALLTTSPTPRERQELVDNITKTYMRGSSAQYAEGMAWYRNAHDLAGIVGFGDMVKGAGVIAALSANTGWTRNVKLAEDIAEGKPVKHFGLVMAKIEKIMGGGDPVDVLGGQKTTNFYLNIAHPDFAGPVTVDRHAHDIARGVEWGNSNRGLSTMSRYDVLADAYREAAEDAGIKPHEMQAVTWVIWRDLIAGTSTRGKRS